LSAGHICKLQLFNLSAKTLKEDNIVKQNADKKIYAKCSIRQKHNVSRKGKVHRQTIKIVFELLLVRDACNISLFIQWEQNHFSLGLDQLNALNDTVISYHGLCPKIVPFTSTTLLMTQIMVFLDLSPSTSTYGMFVSTVEWR
jgi:hypothetical protein